MDENCDLLADLHNILNRWKNYLSQLLNVHRISDVREIEIHIAEPLVSDPSPFEAETSTAKLKSIPFGGWRKLHNKELHNLDRSYFLNGGEEECT
ncbi:hypothetical protein B7P43_G14115 [Cryptotermes secundus]|uniref:Uncharacterized protein n=1 Tax=Cryptotermes secundus TaxID=105785 RepID=A0A2J7PFU2_9NEOP|nr:hypothetical protein B7P43_G14115 [Cryptotermes secundus]